MATGKICTSGTHYRPDGDPTRELLVVLVYVNGINDPSGSAEMMGTILVSDTTSDVSTEASMGTLSKVSMRVCVCLLGFRF